MKYLFIILCLLASIASAATATRVEGQVAIYKGWNIVHGLVNPSQFSAGKLDPSHIKAIYAYLPQLNQYTRLYPNPESSKIEDIGGDDYFEKIALWVYSDTIVEGSFNGMPHGTEYWLEEPLPLDERSLYWGWNFVGVTPDMYKGTYNPGDGKEGEYFSWDAIRGTCNFGRIYAWDAGNQKWFNVDPTTQFKNYDFDDFLLNGMAVKVHDNCRLGFTDERTLPPAFPE